MLYEVVQPNQKPTQEWSTSNVLHLDSLLNYPKTLDLAGEACQEETP